MRARVLAFPGGVIDVLPPPVASGAGQFDSAPANLRPTRGSQIGIPVTAVVLYIANAIAIAILVFALYLPRHHRRDMALAFLGVNVGVLALSATLVTAMAATATAATATGIGIGLFGVLSIIRLRSDEIPHSDVAYYVASLAMALLAGLGSPTSVIPFAFMAAILLVFVVADSPRFTARHENLSVTLDRAIADPTALREHLEQRLGATIDSVRVRRLDLANDLTIVDVQVTRRAVGAANAKAAGAAGVGRGEQPALATVPIHRSTH